MSTHLEGWGFHMESGAWHFQEGLPGEPSMSDERITMIVHSDGEDEKQECLRIAGWLRARGLEMQGHAKEWRENEWLRSAHGVDVADRKANLCEEDAKRFQRAAGLIAGVRL